MPTRLYESCDLPLAKVRLGMHVTPMHLIMFTERTPENDSRSRSLGRLLTEVGPSRAQQRSSRSLAFAAATLITAAFCLLATANDAPAGNVYVPNGSFESPGTVFVDTRIDSWQKTPKPAWFDEIANGPWDQLSGVFLNTSPASTNNDHIVNMQGAQAAFVFASPGSGIFQQLPQNGSQFSGRYRQGRAYDLTVALLGNLGNMAEGATLQLGFYYLDDSSNSVTIASTTVSNSASLFPDRNHFVDFSVRLPEVTANAPWAGKNIGVHILSTVEFTLAGGYWDLDNVRVTESISVPNYSFESPAVMFVDTNIANWAQSPKPAWYDEAANGPWSQLTGVFLNSPPTSTNNDHIVNLDGNQAAFVFASPGAALFQDHLTSSNVFKATYEPGQYYQLSAGVLGNGGGMPEGATLQLALYYIDASSNAVTIASTTITNSNALFPSRTNLLDFHAHLPPVKPTDPWAGKNIGVQIASTTDFQLTGGYWDVDNVRLTPFQAPVLSAGAVTNGQFNLTVRSEPGQRFEVLASTNLTSALTNWVVVGTVTNTAGTATFTDSESAGSQRFYRVQQLL